MASRKLPFVARVLVHATFPAAEREEVCTDLASELEQRRADQGAIAAQLWLTGQLIGSLPALLRRGWWRGRTGFESDANHNRPGGAPLEGLVLDMRFAFRRLRSRPIYALLAVLTLALGVGGGSAIFAIARTFLVDSMPVKDEGRLGVFWNEGGWTEQQFLFLRGKAPGFSAIAVYRPNDETLEGDDGRARIVQGHAVSAELFDVIGGAPLLGRTFQAGDDALNAPPIALLSYSMWQELGGQRSIIGQRLSLAGGARTVVGVMPKGFWFPDPSSRMWVPAPLDPSNRNGNYRIIGRVAPGYDIATMSSALERVRAMLRERFQANPPNWFKDPASITPLRDATFSELRPALIATLVAMGFILLIACANVSALMLGQIEGRTTELAVRTALGADRSRITQQILVESLTIGVLATVAGAAIAAGAFRILVATLPLGALADSVSLDYTLLVASLCLALAAAVAVAMIPIVAVWRGNLNEAIARTRTAGIGGGSSLAGALVVGEVALAVLMVMGAGLVVRSVGNLYEVNPGVARSGVAVVDIVLPGAMDLTDRYAMIGSLITEIEHLPGVRSASMVQKLPLRGRGWSMGFAIEGRSDIGRVTTQVRIAGPGYMRTMGIPVIVGREFDGTDQAGRERSILVNQALVDKYFAGTSPIGKRIATGPAGMGTIVGVVGNVAEAELTDEPAPVRYLPYQQVSFMVVNQTLVIRTTSDDAIAIIPSVRRLMQQSAPRIAIQEATTIDAIVDRAVGPARQVMFLLTLLTSLALILGAIGVYGVIAQFVHRRNREWGIRIALGLSPSRVTRHVISRGAVLIGLGIAAGFTAMTLLTRLVKPFLYGVGAADPAALIAAVTVLALTGLAATLVPALKASRVDPAVIMREQ